VEVSPHTADDLEAMLAAVGATGLDALFDHIPAAPRLDRPLELPTGLTEDEVLGRMSRLAAANSTAAVCFAGGGAYDHVVPAVDAALTSRGELLTAYTPYQPEVSQGMLQALFEYQTAICALTGLPVSNASLYDGDSAVAEAVSMACGATRRRRRRAVGRRRRAVPPSRAHVRAPARSRRQRGRLRPRLRPDAGDRPPPETSAVVLAQPNALGVVEDVRAHAEAAHAAGAQLIVKLEPTAVGLLATPGSQGADLVVGEGQPLAQGLVYGGPTFGFLACTGAGADGRRDRRPPRDARLRHDVARASRTSAAKARRRTSARTRRSTPWRR
jgi:glycine dehydrogenase subunit 1